MDLSLLASNLLNPPILFFALGIAATLVKSDLEIPQSVARLLSIYLLFSIGLQGGHKLAEAGLSGQVAAAVLAGVTLSAVVPLWSFFILRPKLGAPNAAALAATYGSISAVTFITAVGFLDQVSEGYSGHMVAVMAVMESPAIMVGVWLSRRYAQGQPEQDSNRKGLMLEMARESCLNGAVFLLLGSLLIGMVSGPAGWEAVEPLVVDPFKGVLCLFLLDMGLVAARRLRDLRAAGTFLIAFGIVGAVVHGLIGIAVAWCIGMSVGDAVLLAILAGSASYIAVPAAMRMAVPDANPSIYVPMALAITFPFNIAIGIPMYTAIIRFIWSF